MVHSTLTFLRKPAIYLFFFLMLLITGNAFADSVIYSYSASPSNAASSSSNANVAAASCVSTVGNSFGTVSAPVNTSSSSTTYTGASGGGNIGNAVAVTGNATFNSSTSAYISFTLTPNAGYAITITGMSFGSRSTGTGPQGYTISTSVGGFSTSIASGTFPNTSTWTLYTPAISSVVGATATPIEVRVYAYGGAGSASSGTENWRMDDVNFTISVAGSSTDYYSGPTGNLDNVNSWWTGTTGTSGTHPANFTAGAQVFHVSNGTAGTLGANWTVSGSGSKVVVDGTDFTVPSTQSVTATIDVNAGRTLHLSNTTLPTLGILDPASTVEFLNLTSVAVPTASAYGNITFNNSTVALPGATASLVYAGNFTLTGGASFVGANTSLGYSLVTTGSANQTINANGGTLTCWNFDAGFTNTKGSGTLTLNSGNTTLNVNNSFDLNFSGVTNQFSDGGNTISIINNLDCTGSSTSYNLTGTINMNSAGSGSANIRGGGSSSLPCVAPVNNLTINNSIPVQVRGISGGSTFTIKGNLSVLSTATSTLVFNGNTVALAGNLTYGQTTDNITTSTAGSTLLLNGTSGQTYTTSVVAGNTFANITMNNSAGLTLSSPLNVSGTLTLTSGKINTGSNTLSLTSTGTVSGASATSYVNGNFSKTMPSGGTTSKVFEVGDATYSPIQLTFSSSVSSGSITVKSTSGAHPSIATSYINSSNMVNRYWTITNSGVSAATVNAALSYSSGDISGGSNTGYIIRQYAGSWSTAPSVTNSTSGTAPLLAYRSASAGISGASFSGDYVAGAPDCASSAGTAAATPASLCGSGTSALSLTGVTTNTGNTYQWQTSADGTTYTSISGATNSTYTTPSLSATTWYKCVVGCIPTSTSLNSVAVAVTVNPVPSSISGTTSVCPGQTTTLTDAGGGTWTSSNGNATVGTSSGVVTGVTAGTSTITYTLSTGCYTITTVTVLTAPAAITGANNVCTGANTTLTDAGGGTWSSDNSNVAIGSSSGVVSGVTTGTANISYTLGDGCYVTLPFTVNTTPSAITGVGAVCSGASITLTDGGSGTWTSSNGNATVGSASGVVTGVTAGSSNITYTLAGGCYATTAVTVLASPAAISGASTACVGLNITLTDAGGGTWTTSGGSATVGSSSGIVTGVATGSAVVTYTLTNGCFATDTISVIGSPSPISGPSQACIGQTMTLTDAGGGTWSVNNGNATIGSSTGVVTGVAAGTSIVTYTVGSGCYVTTPITVNALPSAISGATSVCTGFATTLTDGSGTWASSNGNATVGAVTGIVTGVTAGTSVITFTNTNGCYVTTTMTVNQSPVAISGTLTVCQGSTTTLSDAGSGTWSSGSTSIATIGTSGIVNALTPGVTLITYTLGCGSVTAMVTVNPLPAIPSILGGSSFVVCAGSNITLTESVSGGTWSSSDNTLATVGTSGVVSGVAAGNPNISYTITNSCGTNYVYSPVTVNPLPGSISGSATVCTGTTTTLTDAGGGTWTSSNPANASIGSATGVLTGIAAGTTNITYTLGTGCFVTTPLTVNPSPAAISGTATSCVGATSTLTDAGGGVWTSSNANATVGSATGIVTGVAAGLATITYTAPNGCIATTVYTINATSAGTITGSPNLCNGGTAAYSNIVPSGTWSSSNTAIATIDPVTGLATGVSVGTDTIIYTVATTCGSYTTINPISVIVSPPAVNITPSLVSLCASCPAVLMTAIGDTIYGSATFSNSTTTFLEPKNSAGLSNITVSGIPAGASITSVSVVFNVKATSGEYQSDNIYNLKAPNGSIINLDNLHGSSGGHGFPNVTISSNGTATFGTATIVTGTNYIASLVSGAPTSGSFTSTTYRATATTWASLYSVPNGTWTFITDNNYSATEDSFKSWSITINYAYLPTVTWAATTGLYTNAGATTAYTGTNTSSVYAEPAATTSYVATATIGGCSKTGTVPVNVGSTLYVPSVSGPSSVCVGSTVNMTDSTTGGTWSSSNTAVATVGSGTGIVTGMAGGVVNITYTYACGSCSNFAVKTITVNTLPVVSPIAGNTSLCLSGAPTSTLTDATSGGTYSWSSSNPAVATIGSSTGVVTAVSTGSTIITYNFSNGICANPSATANVTVAASPTTVFASPLFVSLCSTSSAQQVVATGGLVPGSTTVASGTVNLSVSAAGAVTPSTIAVSGIPTGAVVTGVSAKIDFTSTYLNDYIFNLKAPDGNIINLINLEGPHGAGQFTGTVVSSTGVTPLISGATPFTGTYAADLASGIGGAGYLSNSTNWSDLFATPNGSWTLIANNSSTTFANSPTTLTDWTITINYNYQVPITWTPATGLYTNSGATTAYTSGTNAATVYALPAATTIYTITATNGTCATNSSVTASVSSPLYVPVITGAPAVCVSQTSTLSDSLTGGTWTSSNTALATVGSSTGIVTGVAAGTPNITYTYTNGSCSGFAVKTITVNALPVVAAISGPGTVCNGTTITLTDATSGGTWSSGTPAVATIGTSGIVTPVSVGVATISYSYSNGTCTNVLTTSVNSLNYPASVSVTPSTATVCAAGPAALLYGVGGLIPGFATGSNTTALSFSSTTPGTSPINISGIPAGAAITSVSVTFSATSVGAYASDALFNLQAPNGNILNLVLSEGGSSAAGFINTTFNSSSSTALSSSAAPFTGTFMADNVVGAGLPASTASAWSQLYTAPVNGTWNLICNDIYTSGHYNLTSWSVTINYTTLPAYVWSSTTGLYTNSGATAAYTGTSSDSVYALPAASTTYTVAATNGTCITTGTASVSVNPTPSPISGVAQVCVGLTTTLSDAGSGTWSSSDVTTATIGTSTGIVTGIQAGTATITYTLPTGCFITRIVTVNPLPSSVSGTTNVCVGLSSTLADAGGGTWSSSDMTTATVGSSTGVVTGVAAGNVSITYTLATGCITTVPFTVNPLPASITGVTNVCVGLNTTLSDATGTGTWSSSDNTLAIVGSSTGVVNGVLAGTPIISYTLPTGCFRTAPVTVNPLPSPVSGSPVVCAGSNVTVTDAGSGTWSSSDNTIAGIGSTTGVINGVAAGNATITYMLPTGCITTITATVNPLPSSISGTMNACIGLTSALTDAGGGTWTSSNTALATVGSSSGVVTGVASGIPNITYTLPTGCQITAPFSVNPLPASIIGSVGICVGTSTTLTDATTGGSWSSSDVTVATIGTAGLVNGLAGGVVTITYTLPTGCVATMPMTVYALPSSITGPSFTCTGSSTILTDVSSGGVWTSSNPAVATIGSSSGVVSGVTTGNATITYTISGGCNTTTPITVNSSPAPVTGITSVCAGQTITLSDASTGGTWSSSNTSLATVGSTGIVTGVAGGSPTITYSVSSGCYSTAVVNVFPVPPAHTITGGGGYCTGGTGYHIGLNGSDLGIVYQLYRGATAIGGPVSGTGTPLDFGVQSVPGTYYVSATNTGTTCAANMTGTVIVAINPLPTVYILTGGGSYCAGGAGVDVSLFSSDPGISYQLYNNASPVGAPLAGTGGNIDFGLQTLAGPYNVIATNTTSGCTSMMTSTIAVTINPLPTAYPISGGGFYCSGGTGVHIYLNGSTIGVNYQLFNNVTPSGIFVSGTSATLDFGLRTLTGNYTIVGTNTVTGCINTMSGSTTVSVNPLPPAFSMTGGGGYCTGGSGTTVGLSGSTSGFTYQLYCSGVAVGLPLTGTGAPLTFGPQLLGGTYTVVATNPGTGCTATMTGTSVVVINPLPTVYNVTGGGAYCSGGSGVSIGLNASQTGVNYQLYYGVSPVGSIVAGTGGALNFGSAFTNAGSYTVAATNVATGCSSNMFGSASVVINPLPGAFAVGSSASSYCAGGVGVHITLSGSVTGINYNLYNSGSLAGGTPGTGSALDFGAVLAAGTYTVIAVNTSTLCSATMTGNAIISINALPVVYNVTGGGSYCSSAVAPVIGLSGSTSGISYQLFRSGVSTGSPVIGTGSAISFGVQPVAGSYTIVATNTVSGCSSNMSGSAVITVLPLPSVYSVAGGGGFCAGATGVHVTLSSSNIGVNYQLYNGTAVGAPVSGSGGSIDFGLQTSGGTYTVAGTSTSTGCTVAMAGNAVVTVNPLPGTFPVNGGGNYCAGGAGMPVGLNGSATGVSYLLFVGTTATGSLVAGTGAPISFGNQMAAGTYTVVGIASGTGCSATMSGSAVVSVNPLPANFAVAGGGAFCAGGTGVDVSLSGSSTGISYQLLNNGAPVTGAVLNGTGFALDFGLQTTNGNYTIAATNPATTCSAVMSGSANVTSTALPGLFIVSGGGSYCAGAGGVHIGLSGSTSGIYYQLYRGTASVGAPVAGTGAALDFGLQTTAGSYTVVASNPVTTCVRNMTGAASVVINPLPAAHAIIGGGGYCPGGTGVHVGLNGSDAGVGYQLYNGSLSAGAPANGTGAPVDFGLQTSPGTYSVVATLYATGCTAPMTGTSIVSMNPLPAVHNVTGGGNYCPGGTGVHVSLNGSESGMSYQLFRNGFATGASVAGTGSAIDFGLQTGTGSYTVSATNTATGCGDTMNGTVNIGYYSLPVAHTITGGGAYCAGGAGVHIGLDASDGGNYYQLMRGTTVVGAPLAGTGSALDFGFETAPGTYSVYATSTLTTCNNAMAGSVNVAVNPLPMTFSVTGGGHYCAGGAGVHIVLSGSEPGTNYQLFNGALATGAAVAGTGSVLDFGPQTIAGSYLVVATSATSCTGTMTGTATVSVDPLPAVFNVSGGGAFCSGGSGVHIYLSGSAAGISYQLFAGGSPVGGAAAGTGSSLDFGAMTMPGTYTAVATNAGTSCNNLMNGNAIVSVNSLPANYFVTGSGSSFCSGGTGIDISLTGSDTGVSYQLYNGGVATGAAIAGTSSVIDFGHVVLGGSYHVVATNIHTLCTANMPGAVSVTVNPAPVAYSVTGSGSYCTGGTGLVVGLTGSNAGITYQLYGPAGATGSPVAGTGGAIDFGAQTLPGTYTVRATNAATGCTGDMAGSAVINTNALPLMYNVTGGGSYCAGGTGVHVSLAGSSTGITYSLMNGTSLVSSHAGTGFAIDFGLQTAGGSYTVVAVNNATSCMRTMFGSAVVVVNTIPVAYPVSGGGGYCFGGAGVHVSLGSSDTDVSYQLYLGGTPVGMNTAGTGSGIDFGLQSTAGTYSVKAISVTNGCSNVMTGIASVSVNPAPVVFGVTGGGSYCAGGTGVHIGLSNSTSGISYQLYNGFSSVGSPVYGTGSPLDFGAVTGAGIYKVIATNTGTTCNKYMADSAAVSINATVTPSVTLTDGGLGDTVCSGNLVHFTANGTNGGLAPVFQWSINGVPVSSSSTYSYLPVDGDLVTVTMTSNALCPVPATVGASKSMTVQASAASSVVVTPDPGNTVCKNTLVTLTAVPAYGGSSPSYTWFVNGISSGSSSVYSYTPANGDDVYCRITSNYHCSLSPVASSAHVVFSVDTAVTPIVVISANPGTNIAAGEPLYLTATATNAGPSPSFQWLVNSAPVAGATNSLFTSSNFSNLDVVTCHVISSGVCSGNNGSASVTIHVARVGVQPVVSGTGDIVVVPNPNNGIFTVKGLLGNSADAEVTLEVNNMLGQVVFSKVVKVSNGQINEQVDLGRNLPNAMYLMSVRTPSENHVFHLVVEQ